MRRWLSIAFELYNLTVEIVCGKKFLFDISSKETSIPPHPMIKHLQGFEKTYDNRIRVEVDIGLILAKSLNLFNFLCIAFILSLR